MDFDAMADAVSAPIGTLRVDGADMRGIAAALAKAVEGQLRAAYAAGRAEGAAARTSAPPSAPVGALPTILDPPCKMPCRSRQTQPCRVGTCLESKKVAPGCGYTCAGCLSHPDEDVRNA